MLARIIVFSLILQLGFSSFNPPLEASYVDDDSQQRGEKIVNIVNVIAQGGLCNFQNIKCLLSMLENVSEDYLDEDLFVSLFSNREWSGLETIDMVKELLDIPSQSFRPIVIAVTKLTKKKLLLDKNRFIEPIAPFDGKSAIILVHWLQSIPLDHLDEVVEFILKLSFEQVWEISDYENVIKSIVKIDPDRMSDLFNDVLKRLYPQRHLSSKHKSNKLQFHSIKAVLPFHEIIDYFNSTTSIERQQIEQLSKYLSSEHQNPLLRQIWFKNNCFKPINDEDFEALSATLSNLSHFIPTLNVEEYIKLAEFTRKQGAKKLKTLTEVVKQVTEGLNLSRQEFIDLIAVLMTFSENSMKGLLDDFMPLMMTNTATFGERYNCIKILKSLRPNQSKAISIWTGAQLKKSEMTISSSIALAKVAMEALWGNLSDRDEAIANAAAVVIANSACLDESGHLELSDTLNRIPTTLLMPMVNAALLANSLTECRDDRFLIQTIAEMNRFPVHMDCIHYVSEILSKHTLINHTGANQGEVDKVNAESKGVVNLCKLIYGVQFIPRSQVESFLTRAIEKWNLNVRDYQSSYAKSEKYLKSHLKQLLVWSVGNSEAPLHELYGLWQRIFLTGNKENTLTIVQIFRRRPPLIMLINTELQQLIVTAMRNFMENPFNNPYDLFASFKIRKDQKIDFGRLENVYSTKKRIYVKASDGHRRVVALKVSPQGIYNFSTNMVRGISEDSDVTPDQFVTLLQGLSGQLNQPMFVKNWDVDELNVLIGAAARVDSHMNTLIHKNVVSMPAVYLRCIVHHFSAMPDCERKWLGLANVLSTVRGCNPGQEAAIEKLFFLLEPQMKLRTPVDSRFEDRNVAIYKIINRALQIFCNEMFSEHSAFMREVCQINKNTIMSEPSHQLAAVRGLIGDYVGWPYQLKFDQHAAVLYPTIKQISCQKLLESYYSHLDVTVFIQKMHNAINDQLCSKENANQGLSGKLVDILEEDAELSLKMEYKDDEDDMGQFKGLTSYGTTALLNKLDILVPASF